MKQWKQQDEDVLTYALFPQVATDFFKNREAQQKKVDATVADTKNGAYPVYDRTEKRLVFSLFFLAKKFLFAIIRMLVF